MTHRIPVLAHTRLQNIRRYERLLDTRLTDFEREFLERRLAEEKSALQALGNQAPHSEVTRG
jgi:hypothetical protein